MREKPNQALEALMDLRDDLKIRLSLLTEHDDPNPLDLLTLQRELARAEREIANYVPSRNA